MCAGKSVPPRYVTACEEVGLTFDLTERPTPRLLRSLANETEWSLSEPDEVTAGDYVLRGVPESFLFLALVHRRLVHDDPLRSHARELLIAGQDVPHHRESLRFIEVWLPIDPLLMIDVGYVLRCLQVAP